VSALPDDTGADTTGWIPLQDVARLYHVGQGTLSGWVRAGKLPFRHVCRRGYGGRAYLVDPAAAAVLLAGLRERQAKEKARKERRACLPRPHHKVSLGVCRAGLEPDAVTDAHSECDAVAGTLGHGGLVWTPHDLKTLRERRESFAKLLGRAA
jgi:hypothetical protein